MPIVPSGNEIEIKVSTGPMSTGYSGTPLNKKLGIKPDHVVALIDAPKQAASLLAPLPAGVVLRTGARGKPDISLVFCSTIKKLEQRVEQLWRLAYPDRVVWIGWPKKSSNLFIDLTEGKIRELVLGKGLVDVKVCAIDSDWSGLKLVVRKELR